MIFLCSYCKGRNQEFFPEEAGERWKECLDCGKRTMIEQIIPIDTHFRLSFRPEEYLYGRYYPQYRFGEQWHTMKNYWSAATFCVKNQEDAYQVVEAFRHGMGSSRWGEWCKRTLRQWEFHHGLYP